jgi:hypothetical protein
VVTRTVALGARKIRMNDNENLACSRFVTIWGSASGVFRAAVDVRKVKRVRLPSCFTSLHVALLSSFPWLCKTMRYRLST